MAAPTLLSRKNYVKSSPHHAPTLLSSTPGHLHQSLLSAPAVPGQRPKTPPNESTEDVVYSDYNSVETGFKRGWVDNPQFQTVMQEKGTSALVTRSARPALKQLDQSSLLAQGYLVCGPIPGPGKGDSHSSNQQSDVAPGRESQPKSVDAMMLMSPVTSHYPTPPTSPTIHMKETVVQRATPPGGVVEMNLRLDMDFQAAGHEDSIQRQAFINDLKQDLADASGMGTSDFNILKVSQGSVVVDMDAPEEAAQEIQRQSIDPNSRLRSGKVTRFTDKITLPSEEMNEGDPLCGNTLKKAEKGKVQRSAAPNSSILNKQNMSKITASPAVNTIESTSSEPQLLPPSQETSSPVNNSVMEGHTASAQQESKRQTLVQTLQEGRKRLTDAQLQYDALVSHIRSPTRSPCSSSLFRSPALQPQVLSPNPHIDIRSTDEGLDMLTKSSQIDSLEQVGTKILSARVRVEMIEQRQILPKTSAPVTPLQDGRDLPPLFDFSPSPSVASASFEERIGHVSNASIDAQLRQFDDDVCIGAPNEKHSKVQATHLQAIIPTPPVDTPVEWKNESETSSKLTPPGARPRRKHGVRAQPLDLEELPANNVLTSKDTDEILSQLRQLASPYSVVLDEKQSTPRLARIKQQQEQLHMQIRHLFEAQTEAEAAKSWAALEEVDAIEEEQDIMLEISRTSCPSGVRPMASDSLDVSPSFLPPEQMQLLFEARAEVDAAKSLAALEEAEAKEEEQAIMQEISQASGLIGVTMSSAQDHVDLQMLVSSPSSYSTDAQLISLGAPKAFMDPGQMMHKIPISDVHLAAKLAQERLFEADECKKQTFREANVPSPPGSRKLAKEIMEIIVHKGQEECKYNKDEQETRLREAELRRRHDMVEAMRDEWNIHRAIKHWQITTISAAWVHWQYEHEIRLHQKQGFSATASTARCPSASETPAPIQLQNLDTCSSLAGRSSKECNMDLVMKHSEISSCSEWMQYSATKPCISASNDKDSVERENRNRNAKESSAEPSSWMSGLAEKAAISLVSSLFGGGVKVGKNNVIDNQDTQPHFACESLSATFLSLENVNASQLEQARSCSVSPTDSDLYIEFWYHMYCCIYTGLPPPGNGPVGAIDPDEFGGGHTPEVLEFLSALAICEDLALWDEVEFYLTSKRFIQGIVVWRNLLPSINQALNIFSVAIGRFEHANVNVSALKSTAEEINRIRLEITINQGENSSRSSIAKMMAALRIPHLQGLHESPISEDLMDLPDLSRDEDEEDLFYDFDSDSWQAASDMSKSPISPVISPVQISVNVAGVARGLQDNSRSRSPLKSPRRAGQDEEIRAFFRRKARTRASERIAQFRHSYNLLLLSSGLACGQTDPHSMLDWMSIPATPGTMCQSSSSNSEKPRNRVRSLHALVYDLSTLQWSKEKIAAIEVTNDPELAKVDESPSSLRIMT